MPKLFGGLPPQAPAAPGTPGIAAGPQPGQIPQAPMMPQQDIDPGLMQFMQEHPHLDPTMAKISYENQQRRPVPKQPLFAPQPSAPSDPYQRTAESLIQNKYIK